MYLRLLFTFVATFIVCNALDSLYQQSNLIDSVQLDRVQHLLGRGSEVIIDGKPYYLDIATQVPWRDAFAICRGMNMSLLSLQTQQESDAVLNFLSSNDAYWWYVWMSGRREANETNWTWMSTGEPVTYTRWAAKQPDWARDQPACMNAMCPHGSWADENCNWGLWIMCEIEN